MPEAGITTEGIYIMATHAARTKFAAPEHVRRRRAVSTIRQKSRTVCAATGKTRYRDRTTAREALDSCRWQRTEDLAARGTSGRTEVRIYECSEPTCNGGVHLTSIRAWHAA
ncbi:hypothetical protein [Microbacterium paulum]